MQLPVLDIREVAERQLCCGCGACAAVSPESIRMVDDERFGRRPLVSGPATPASARTALAVCPGVALEHTFDRRDPALNRDLLSAWGPVYGVWEGHAGDRAIRWGGSSGGAASALALHALEAGGMHAVLHTGARADRPYLNETVLSRTREELLERTGSRYAPASPCDGLGLVESAPGPCVVIGKPCDIAATAKARRLRPELDRRIGLTIAFFCAGTPSTAGTLALLRKVGVGDPDSVTALRFRGNGWPGRWTARWTDASGAEREASLTYDESWGFLQRYRQWRCTICPDHSGEFADVAVGDPWHRQVQEGEPGSSLIVARTPRGREAILAAAEAGYLTLEREDATLLPRSQPNLLSTRGRLWGQMLALRLLGVPRPVYRGFDLFRWWLGLPLKKKLQSTLGTARRVRSRGLRRRTPVAATEHAPRVEAGTGAAA